MNIGTVAMSLYVAMTMTVEEPNFSTPTIQVTPEYDLMGSAILPERMRYFVKEEYQAPTDD